MKTRLSGIVVFLLITFNLSFGQTTRHYLVILRSNTGSITLWDGNVTDIFGFASTLGTEPTLPGKTLYAEEGDTVIINAWSVSQGDHHTIHLHGLDVDTRNDGDPMTSFALQHMSDTTYTFIAHNAGTYIYHCHVGDVVHVQMGMYGLIVVKAAGGANTAWTGGPSYNKDYKWLMTELDKSWHDNIPVHDTSNHTIQLPPYQPDYFLINGKSQQQLNHDSIAIKGAVGESIYLRLANIGFFDNRVILPASLNAVVIDSDGRPLPSSVQTDTIYISPGERYGVMLNPSVEFTGTVAVEYINMNTGSVWQTELPPVTISGFTGINEHGEDDSQASVYPNPASNFLEIEMKNKKISLVEYTMINALGEVVLKEVTELSASFSNKKRIDVSQFNAGVYYLQINTSTEQYNKKIVLVK